LTEPSLGITWTNLRGGCALGTTLDKPGLVYFHSSRSGKCRRIEGYIAQVLPSLGEEAVLQVTLADLVPDYQFALRHHSPQLMETVLYCWTD